MRQLGNEVQASWPERWVAAWGRSSRRFEIGLLVVMVALFVYALLAWLGVLSFERGSQPLRMVFFSAALILQSVAVLIQRRSMTLFCGLLAISMLLIWKALTVAA